MRRFMLASAAMDLQTRLLIVDDDPGILELMAAFLREHGFVVDAVSDGAAMRARLGEQSYDLLILDVMMPGEDGLSLLRAMDARRALPVIMVSAIGSDVDRIVGLEMGADDYLSKPFNPRELLARIRAVLRRRTPDAPAIAAVGQPLRRFAGWRLDIVVRELFDPDDVLINLSDGEFRLLAAFVASPRRVLSRDQLLDLSRGVNADHFDRAIDVQVSRLRRKLTRPGQPELIRTVRNEGYMFSADVAG